MTVIVSAPPVNWSLTRESLCDRALAKLNEIGVGETPSAASRALALEALEGVLKTLQFQGLSWPQLSRGEIEFTLFKDEPQQALPADYYGFAEIHVTGGVTGGSAPQVPLCLVPTAEWQAIPDRHTRGDFPRRGWIDNANVLWLWPVPHQNVACHMFYQGVIDDSRPGTAPRLRAPWMLALPYGIAIEMAEEFEISDAKLQRLTQKWSYYLNLCLMNEAETAPFSVTVRSGVSQ